jgi:DNA-directed RNA polymerase specialized sigma subunit
MRHILDIAAALQIPPADLLVCGEYVAKLRLAEIAEVFDLTESRICQIHAQNVIGLRAYLKRVREK